DRIAREQEALLAPVPKRESEVSEQESERRASVALEQFEDEFDLRPFSQVAAQPPGDRRKIVDAAVHHEAAAVALKRLGLLGVGEQLVVEERDRSVRPIALRVGPPVQQGLLHHAQLGLIRLAAREIEDSAEPAHRTAISWNPASCSGKGPI